MSEKIWMIRAGFGGFLDEFRDKGIIALGWDDTGELPGNISRENLKERIRVLYPDFSARKLGQSVGQL